MAISKKNPVKGGGKKPIKGDKKDIVSKVVKDIEKEVKQPTKASSEEKLFFAKTGSTLLDLAGGFAFGKIVNLVGDNSTGKTLLAMECIAQTYYYFEKEMKGKKLKWVYDDAEAGFSFDSKKIYDIDIVKEKDIPSETVEDFDYNLDNELNKLKENEYLIYVLDSLDSLSSGAEKERVEMRRKTIAEQRAGKKTKDLKGSYGMEKQKSLGEMFRQIKIKLKNKNCLLIIISQVRENIGVTFGEKYRRVGGKALDFYASVIWWLSELQKNKVKNVATSIVVKARNKKNKVSKPYRTVHIQILFDYGVDDISSNIEYLYELRGDDGKLKNKENLKWGKKDFSLKQLIRYIEKNELEGELKEKTIKKWNEFEASITPNRKRKF